MNPNQIHALKSLYPYLNNQLFKGHPGNQWDEDGVASNLSFLGEDYCDLKPDCTWKIGGRRRWLSAVGKRTFDIVCVWTPSTSSSSPETSLSMSCPSYPCCPGPCPPHLQILPAPDPSPPLDPDADSIAIVLHLASIHLIPDLAVSDPRS